MDASNVVWGLDIGHTSIKAVKLERSPGGGGAAVLGYAIEPIPVGEDVDRDDAVVTALGKLAQREEFGITPVFAALSGRQVLSRSINVPIINENKVNRMVELEARQQIPGNFDDVRWGYHMSPGLDGASYDVALFAARKDIVEDLIGKCRRAGLTLSGISVSSLAIYNFVQYDQEFQDDESVVVLDVGAENTDLVVYQGDTLWMRSLGVAGNDITRTFQKKFRVGFEEAEQLKCQVGDSRQSDRIMKVIESSLVELCGDVQRSLGFYKSQNSHARFENVVVSGNTFRMPGLIQFMADRLGYAIITLIELEKITVAPGLDREHFLEDLQSLGVAMGLGLQGLGIAKANVNLLPSSLQVQSILRQKRWAMVALLLILPATFLANYAVNDRRLEDAVAKYGTMSRDIKQAEERSAKALAAAIQIPGKADEAASYGRYWEQAGLIAAIEQGVFRVVSELAQDDGLVKTAAPGDPRAGANADTPIRQPLYLSAIEVPDPTGGDAEANPFLQHSAGREVLVTIAIPRHADRGKIITRMIEGLRALRQSPEVWRALNPTKAELPAELPPLFRPDGVDTTPNGLKPDVRRSWTFFDRFHINEEGRSDPKQYQVELVTDELTFFCSVATR